MSPLHRALELVETGTHEIASPEPAALGYGHFQETAEALLEAKASGLVYEAKEERSNARATYGHIKRVLIAGGLTPKGNLSLASFRATPLTPAPVHGPSTVKEQEILQLRPGLWGMSVDLKALWRKWRKNREA